jgi:hypothetical protein
MYSADQKYREAKREVGYRQHVYGKMVKAGNMLPEEAKMRIAIMSEIAEEYRKQAEADAPQIKFPDSY